MRFNEKEKASPAGPIIPVEPNDGFTDLKYQNGTPKIPKWNGQQAGCGVPFWYI